MTGRHIVAGFEQDSLPPERHLGEVGRDEGEVILAKRGKQAVRLHRASADTIKPSRLSAPRHGRARPLLRKLASL
jgi:hypothetical protein